MTRRTTPRSSFRDVLSVQEYRWLWIADAQSIAGDQLARVALAILVFQRTNSAIATAATYALTFLPAIVGGALLSGIADRHSRRDVMIACDLVRAGLVGAMAISGLSLVVVSALLVLAVLAGSPFTAAQSALLPDMLDGDRYVVATALRTLTNQLAQLAGFAGGGLLVAALGPRSCLAFNALTFVVSAIILRATQSPHEPRITADAETEVGNGAWGIVRFIASDTHLRAWLGLACVFGFYVAPEGIAAPFVTSIGGGIGLVGVLMAAAPAGSALGAVLFVRWILPDDRPRFVGPMAVGAGLPLMLFSLKPNGPIAVVLLAISGVLSIYTIEAITSFTRAIPSDRRGQAVGIASSCFLVAQGAGVFFAGWLTEEMGAARTIAICGALGVAASLALTASLARAKRRFVTNKPMLS